MLRPLTLDDLADLAPLHAEESFWWYPLRRGQTQEETRNFIQTQITRAERGEPTMQAAIERASGTLIGWIGLGIPHFLPDVLPAVEVGWRLGRRWRGQGLATEGAAAALRFGFEELELDEIISLYEPENMASGRVMDRLGLAHDRVVVHPERGIDVAVRRLSHSRWRTARSSNL